MEQPPADSERERIKGFFAALSCIEEEIQEEEREDTFSQFRESQELASLLETFGLTRRESGPVSSIFLRDGIPVFSLGINDDGFFTLYSFAGGSLPFTTPDQGVYDFVRRELEQSKSSKSAGKEDPWTERIKAQVNLILADEGFRHSLQESGLFLYKVPRQDEEYIYFDFRDKTKNIVGSIGFQRITGRAYVFDKEGVPIENIGSLNTGSIYDDNPQKKKSGRKQS
jgi:hypothetical protein